MHEPILVGLAWLPVPDMIDQELAQLLALDSMVVVAVILLRDEFALLDPAGDRLVIGAEQAGDFVRIVAYVFRIAFDGVEPADLTALDIDGAPGALVAVLREHRFELLVGESRIRQQQLDFGNGPEADLRGRFDQRTAECECPLLDLVWLAVPFLAQSPNDSESMRRRVGVNDYLVLFFAERHND